MKRLTALVLLCAVLGAAPASAMRAHHYLDADQRGKVTLPVVSAVPEPSGLAMLACGLLLLLFVPYTRDEQAIAPELVNRPGSSL